MYEEANFKINVRMKILKTHENEWYLNLRDTDKNPILRLYNNLKRNLCPEPYLDIVKDPRHRIAITHIRANAHSLEVERGRYTRPKTPLSDRLCKLCNVVEDEIHFCTACVINKQEREVFYNKITKMNKNFTNLDDKNRFLYMVTCEDKNILLWLGKFLYDSFEKHKNIDLLSIPVCK